MNAQKENEAPNHTLAHLIKDHARSLGFAAVGICDATPLTEAGDRLDAWLDKGWHGTMQWMFETRRERRDPKSYFPDARSIIVVALNYYQEHQTTDAQVSYARYAVGRDYHKVLRAKLNSLGEFIRSNSPGATFRPCVDSFPVMEKPLGVAAGLGWQGKNTNLIIKKHGSYVFLGELLTSVLLPPDKPFFHDHCGNCNRCQTACPTNALAESYTLNATECIAYLTIERKGPLPEDLAKLLSTWVFGCDICQEVCPWNKFAKPTNEPDFSSRLKDQHYLIAHLLTLTEADFQKVFEGTPIRRAGFKKFMESLHAVQKFSPSTHKTKSH